MTTTELLFGTALHPVSTKELARIAGVSEATIRNWKRNPDTIPLGKLRMIVRARRLNTEQIGRMMER